RQVLTRLGLEPNSGNDFFCRVEQLDLDAMAEANAGARFDFVRDFPGLDARAPLPVAEALGTYTLPSTSYLRLLDLKHAFADLVVGSLFGGHGGGKDFVLTQDGIYAARCFSGGLGGAPEDVAAV